MDKKMLKLLVRSLDDDLSKEEKKQLEIAIEKSENLRKEKEKLLKLKALVEKQEYKFKPFFAGRVMNKIEQQKDKKVIFPDFLNGFSVAFKRVVLSGAAAILLLIFSIYFSEGSFSFNSLLGVDSLSNENLVTYLLFDF